MLKNDLKFVDYVAETMAEEYAILAGRVEAISAYIDYCKQLHKLPDGDLLLYMLGTKPSEYTEFLESISCF